MQILVQKKVVKVAFKKPESIFKRSGIFILKISLKIKKKYKK
jgi:hypothetical protein